MPRRNGKRAGRRSVLLRGLVLVAALGASSCAPAEDAEPPDSRPNIVFVLLDDVRADDLEHAFLELPNIRALAEQGARFENFFTVAPLCSPSRAVFLTGRYPHQNGILDNRERAAESHTLRTFPAMLHEAGYQSGFVGKWHMGHEDASPRPGFDRWVSFVGQGVYFDPEMNIDGLPATESGYITEVLTRYAVDFVAGTDPSRPFTLFLAHKAVHPEIHPGRVRSFPPAPGDEELYGEAVLPRSPSYRAPLDGKEALARITEYDDPRSPEGGTPDAEILGRLRMLSAVDRSVGDLMAVLEETGRMDRTVFVLTSDQGFFYGEFGLAQERRLPYEPSIRIPLIVRYPAMTVPGSTVTQIATNLDVAPTLLELGNVLPPRDMAGQSLVPAMRDGAELARPPEFMIEYYSDEVFERIVDMGYKALRTDRYKYIRYQHLEGMDELYDLTMDPHEMDNVVDRVDPDVIATLDASLDRILRSTGPGSP